MKSRRICAGLYGKYPLWLPLLLAAFPAWTQTIAVHGNGEVRQKDAIDAMQESIGRQLEAVQKQVGPASSHSFFLLPRAASLGTNTGPAAPLEAPVLAPPPLADCEPLPPLEIDSMIGETAQREGLSADLLRTVMKQESAFRPCAVSSKGAMGLMQLMPSTAEQFGVEDPFDPASNLAAGARLLKQLLTKYGGDVPKALGAYNAGPSKVDAVGGVPQIPETVDYIRQILTLMPGK